MCSSDLPYSTKKLCEWLDVTPDRARTLNLLTIVPAEVAAERKPPPGGIRGQKKQARLAALKEIIDPDGRGGVLPRGGQRKLEELLRQRGIEANRTSLGRELKELWPNITGTRGRPKVTR